MGPTIQSAPHICKRESIPLSLVKINIPTGSIRDKGYGISDYNSGIKDFGFGRIEMRKNLIRRWAYGILNLRSINGKKKAGEFMVYALQDEKVNETINYNKMLDRGIDDMEVGRELPLTEAFVKITELRNRRRNAEV